MFSELRVVKMSKTFQEIGLTVGRHDATAANVGDVSSTTFSTTAFGPRSLSSPMVRQFGIVIDNLF